MSGICQVLFDFERPAGQETWYPVNDMVMGGHSVSEFVVLSGSVAVFMGTVSIENDGGFASVHSRPSRVDLSWATGLQVCFCGDGKRYKLRVRTDASWDGINYEAAFDTVDNGWHTETLPFAQFRPTLRGRRVWDAPALDASSIYSFGILIADRQEGPFRLEIDWLRAYALE
jgi:NADH dehydrogenase [ubiquinone] 1 alpha subcomplex assembly factor 1